MLWPEFQFAGISAARPKPKKSRSGAAKLLSQLEQILDGQVAWQICGIGEKAVIWGDRHL